MTESDERDPIDEPGPVIREVPRRGFARRHWKGLLLTFLVVVPFAIFAAWSTATLGYAYSTGNRVGYNQKISRKGWVCKTWEGEIAISSVPGVAPQLFRYSVRSDSIAHAIESHAGQMVEITYEEHRGVPTKCFGETDYYATGVRKVGP